jgi:hypothetical protein
MAQLRRISNYLWQGRERHPAYLIIFEAVLPNPKPGCREGCLAVAQFWKSLSSLNDSSVRAQKLAQFFYQSLPGFRPVVHIDHYSAKGVSGGYGSSGSGQIRTNQFLQSPWLLKEFKTLIDCGTSPCRFHIVPIMVKVNPHGPLWNEDVANNAGPLQARATAFQTAVRLQVAALASSSLTGITYSVAPEHDAAQSQSQQTPGFVDNYLTQFNSATGVVNVFRTGLGSDAAAHSLTTSQIINRAMTQSCAGCHMPSTFGLHLDNSLGPLTTPTGGMTSRWPDALLFVHVDTPISSPPELAGSVFGSGQGHQISPALLNIFLPDRKNFLLSQLNSPRCFCKRRFPFLDKPTISKVLPIEEKIERLLEPKIKALNKEVKSLAEADADGARREELEEQAAAVMAQSDRQMDAELRKLRIQVPSMTLKPEVLKFRAGKMAKGKMEKEGELRQQELLQLIQEEPSRRTVTGSFRVH